MITFDHFPEGKICKLCGTGEDKKCTLIPIDGTESGGNVQAEVVHVECIAKMNLRYNPLHYVFYQVVNPFEDEEG